MQHDRAITQSFGPQAEAYLTSQVHATGKDLELLAEVVSTTPNARVLDLGCGAGHASFAVAPIASEVVSYDLTEAMLRVVEQAAADRRLANIHTVRGSVERLPFSDASFDWVVSRYSAHHWRNLDAALAELARVLRPGGQVCFIDVMGGPEPLLDTHIQALELLRDPSHVRNYSESEWLGYFLHHSFSARVSHRWRLRIEFASWIARIGTAADRVAAIRTLWAGAPVEVPEHYALAGDLSFELDAAMLLAAKTD